VEALLDEVARSPGADSAKVVLGGFSQGAMVALDAALHSQRPLAGLVLLSGTHLAADEWAPRMGARRTVPVFMSHGQADELLPFGIAEGLRDALRAQGLAVDWVPFRGGHGIPGPVLDGVGAFLTRVLA
jgi:phospholipase/carboxylesterase